MSQCLIALQEACIYQKEKLILSDINFTLNKGEFVYLTGRVGSGKTSLLKTIYAALPLLEGKGRVGEFDLASLTDDLIPYLRRSMGMVFQDFKLLIDRTVYENLNFVLKATSKLKNQQINQRIQEVLAEVNLEDKQQKYPHQLSGGEQQRIAIARALLNEPALLLADEPTGNLDPSTADSIMDLFQKINQKSGTAILMATHNYQIINKYPARIVFLENQSLYELESVKELIGRLV